MGTIYHIEGNAIDVLLQSVDSVLLHVVNCQRVMNSGIALEIKNRIPSAYNAYLSIDLILGSISYGGDVINLVAQDRYGRDKRHLNYGALSTALADANNLLPHHMNVIIPHKMGCDRAGGDWEVVKEMVEFIFKDRDITFVSLQQ